MTWDDWFSGRYEPDPFGGCLLWFGRTNRDGYGLFNRQSFRGLAHRKSYEVATGEAVPSGKVVMHSCDIPCCINPAHLRVGTQLENIQDRVLKGRSRGGDRTGSRNMSAKLTAKDVEEIRYRWRRGDTFAAIARDYPVSVSQIRRIALGERWNTRG